MTRVLVVVGGWAHPAEQTGLPTAAALDALGLRVEVVAELEDVVAPLTDAVDLLVVHTCRFQMLDARYTPAQRAEFAERTPSTVRAAISSHLAAGRPILAMHTAPICFDDWSDWPDIVGGQWDWARSNHPPPGLFRVEPDPTDPITDGLASFEVVDELYRFVTPIAGARVLASAVDADGITQPIVWCHEPGGARVAYDSLGHDERSLADPGHRLLLGRLVEWLGLPTNS